MSFTIVEDCEQELLTVIENFINACIDFDIPKIYFSGEGNSNQTDFEHKSNEREICVLASNEMSGLAMLRLLRIIIDDCADMLLECVLGCDYDHLGTTLTYKKIMENLASCEKHYSESFELNSKITTNFMRKECNFTKRLDQIDIWTLPRIMENIRELY
jgi:hypothetical protein